MNTASDPASVVLIDGRSGAGKTDYAIALALHTGATLVSLDDVYPGWDGLDAGSWHVWQALIVPLSAGGPGRYRCWDWERGAPSAWVAIPKGSSVVIEGCGVLRGDVEGITAQRLWIEATDDVRRGRALARDGELYQPHWTRWALQEERFISRHGGVALADEIINTSEGTLG